MTAMISARDVRKVYDGGMEALKGVSIDIEDGEIVGDFDAEGDIKDDEIVDDSDRKSESKDGEMIDAESVIEDGEIVDDEESDIEDGEIVDDCDGESEIEADEQVAAFDEDDSEDEELGTKPRVLKSLKKLFSDE